MLVFYSFINHFRRFGPQTSSGQREHLPKLHSKKPLVLTSAMNDKCVELFTLRRTSLLSSVCMRVKRRYPTGAKASAEWMTVSIESLKHKPCSLLHNYHSCLHYFCSHTHTLYTHACLSLTWRSSSWRAGSQRWRSRTRLLLHRYELHTSLKAAINQIYNHYIWIRNEYFYSSRRG